VKRITPAAARLLSQDVEHLSQFVGSLANPILKENLDELVQTVALMQTTDPDEFFDVSQANKKYGRVDRNNGAILLEKFVIPYAMDIRFLTLRFQGARRDNCRSIGCE
jgi:exocyst complex component 6